MFDPLQLAFPGDISACPKCSRWCTCHSVSGGSDWRASGCCMCRSPCHSPTARLPCRSLIGAKAGLRYSAERPRGKATSSSPPRQPLLKSLEASHQVVIVDAPQNSTIAGTDPFSTWSESDTLLYRAFYPMLLLDSMILKRPFERDKW